MTRLMQADGAPFELKVVAPTTRTCSVSLSSCLISPYGDVLPCIELRIPAGNVRNRSFAEIWTEGGIFRQLRSRHMMKNLPECHVCPINRYCEGRCSGLALKEHGDLYGGHTLACNQAQARFAQINPGREIPETPLQARLRSESASEPKQTQSQTIPLFEHSAFTLADRPFIPV
jgi:radical SAM protein with 4Fe4S-binding SPASM domain